MKNNSTLSIVAIIAALFVLSVVAYADTGPPGNSGQVIVGPGHAGYHTDIGPNTFSEKIAAVYQEARYIDSTDNVAALWMNTAIVCAIEHWRHVFRDSAPNPAAEIAAPSNPANLANFSITRGEETPQVIVIGFSGSSTPVLPTTAAGSLQNSNTLSTTSANTGPPIKQIVNSSTIVEQNNFGRAQIAHDIGARDHLNLVTTAGG